MLQIHSGNLYKVLRDFHILTGARVELLDKKLNILVHYPPEKIDFCRIVSEDTELGTKCAECDWNNSQICAKTKSVVHYRCHMGLTEAIMPIFDSNGILGYVMFGQVLMQERGQELRQTLKKRFSEEAFPGITDAIDSIPAKTASELSACITILQSLVTFFLSNQWILPARSEFIRHMDKFIETNLSQKITVEDICEEFHIRRTRLYSAAQEYLGCSIAKYIRTQRISHACRLLRETDLSVTAIADRVGFSEYRHFSRVFQQVAGVSAMEYRRRNR